MVKDSMGDELVQKKEKMAIEKWKSKQEKAQRWMKGWIGNRACKTEKSSLKVKKRWNENENWEKNQINLIVYIDEINILYLEVSPQLQI